MPGSRRQVIKSIGAGAAAFAGLARARTAWAQASAPLQPSTSERIMIIDCHGHYTTAPRELQAYRDRQIAALKDGSPMPAKDSVKISDDQLRESVQSQLKFQRERGTDMAIFSPRAAGMGHHIGNAAVSAEWSQVCNELIHRVCSLYPENFIGVCQLPQSPVGSLRAA